MPYLLTMPKLSPTMIDGTIVKWHKKIGDSIQAGDLLLEIATDKATVEHNAIDEGWVRKILVQEGQEVAVNSPLAIITETKDENIDNYQVPSSPEKTTLTPDEEPLPSLSNPSNESRPITPRTETLRQPAFTPEPPLSSYEFEYPRETAQNRIIASPLAKKIAKEKGLDLSSVKGSGPNQRIMKRDLERAQTLSKASFGQHKNPLTPPGSYEETPFSPMRKVIAQRLQDSKSFIPHFYLNLEIDAEPLVAISEQLKKSGTKITLNTFIIKGCALALKDHPNINIGFNSLNQTQINFKTIDIAVAVSLPDGLITPIIRHADYKKVGEISVEIRDLAQRAKEGKLTPQEYKGGSFTLSNMGMFNVTQFQAIINPPQAAILAVGAVKTLPVVKENTISIGKRMNLTLSVDHRVIDGGAAAQFMQTLQYYLENPVMLLL
jgi:pyruvate dehydrogenase E2 component (dihydrolipoamide acetyltransferase)